MDHSADVAKVTDNLQMGPVFCGKKDIIRCTCLGHGVGVGPPEAESVVDSRIRTNLGLWAFPSDPPLCSIN